MGSQTFDIIVIGLGAVGSAIAYQAAKRGYSVLGIDRYTPPHDRGSSHGETRITRQAIGEGKEFTPLSIRSYEIWRELEAETNEELLRVTGGLIISSEGSKAVNHVEDFFATTLAAAREHCIPHRI